MIKIEGQTLRVDFKRYGLEEHELFLRCKALPESEVAYDRAADVYTITAPARFASLLGVQNTAAAMARLPLSPHLFDFQQFITGRALDARRFAAWCDTGLGKTHIFLEWALQIKANGRVLIFSPLQIIPQTRRIAREYFDLDVDAVGTREELADWCKRPGQAIGICNYEKLVPGVMPELRYLAGLVLDESSILKSGGGVIKWNLIKSARGIEYKLSCTAAPIRLHITSIGENFNRHSAVSMHGRIRLKPCILYG